MLVKSTNLHGILPTEYVCFCLGFYKRTTLWECPCDTVGSIEDEVKLLQNKKLTERQQAAAQLRFSEKVILQKTLDAVRR